MTFNMFHIPSYQIQVENWTEKQSQLLRLCNDSEFMNDDGISEVQTSYYGEDQSLNLVHDVVNILRREIQRFGREFDIRNPIVDYAWFQKYNDKDFHIPHNHGSEGWSCVVYIKFDPEVHKPTNFIAPFYDTKGSVITHIPKVNEGTMIFFPAMLTHYAPPSESHKTRIILSFNIRTREMRVG